MNHNIIFIDDEIEILNAYSEIFKSQDVEVLEKLKSITGIEVKNENSDINAITSNSGKEGVSKINQYKADNPIKVAFIDMRMPNGLNGLETAKEIHKVDPRVEIVFVTAYSDINLKEINNTLKKTNKVLFLKKPFQEDVIQQTARNLISKYDYAVIKDNFISSVSHELKTPISSIMGFSSLLKDMDLGNDEREMATLVYKSSKILNSLIENLMRMSFYDRFDNNNIEIFDVSEIIKDCIEISRYRIDQKDIELILDIPYYEVKTDKSKITQVFLSIIDNAIKFTNEGSVSISLKMDCYGNYIEIKDTGIGIPKEELSNIFNKFTRLETKVHEKDGLGMGLYICKKILDQLNHKITIESENGTTVKVFL